jgi:Polyketide cyclase / dehydrase and lipid transport
VNFEFRNSFTVVAAPDAVWKAIADFAGEEGQAMLAAAQKQEGADGSRNGSGRQGGPRLKVVECTPPSRFVAEIAHGSTQGRSAYYLEASATGTEVVHVLTLDLRGIMRLTAPFLRAGLRREHEALRVFVAEQAA